MPITISYRIKHAYKTAAEWAAAIPAPVLLAGEYGIESDTEKRKLGDGTTAWSALPYDGAFGAALNAINALTPSANTFAYFTDPTTAALTGLTAFGRSLLDDADAAAGRATLGLGSVDNTADSVKPVSTAQATALAAKAPLVATQLIVAASGALSVADIGKQIVFTTGGVTLTLPDDATAAIPAAALFYVLNFSGAAVTIARGAGVALYDTAVTNADVTMAFGQHAWLTKNGANNWAIWLS